jgi:cell division protease FtsH
LGVTVSLPIDEKHNYSRTWCLDRMATMLGGRSAELLVFGDLSTGSGNDIEQATELARKMVCEWGMSPKIGPITWGKKEQEIFLGREFATHRDFSEQTAQAIDREIKSLVDNASKRASTLLKRNIDTLHALSRALLENESLDGDEVDRIMKGETIPGKAKSNGAEKA